MVVDLVVVDQGSQWFQRELVAYYGHSYVAMSLYIEFRNQSQKFILDSTIQSPNPYYQLE